MIINCSGPVEREMDERQHNKVKLNTIYGSRYKKGCGVDENEADEVHKQRKPGDNQSSLYNYYKLEGRLYYLEGTEDTSRDFAYHPG